MWIDVGISLLFSFVYSVHSSRWVSILSSNICITEISFTYSFLLLLFLFPSTYWRTKEVDTNADDNIFSWKELFYAVLTRTHFNPNNNNNIPSPDMDYFSSQTFSIVGFNNIYQCLWQLLLPLMIYISVITSFIIFHKETNPSTKINLPYSSYWKQRIGLAIALLLWTSSTVTIFMDGEWNSNNQGIGSFLVGKNIYWRIMEGIAMIASYCWQMYFLSPFVTYVQRWWIEQQ